MNNPLRGGDSLDKTTKIWGQIEEACGTHNNSIRERKLPSIRRLQDRQKEIMEEYFRNGGIPGRASPLPVARRNWPLTVEHLSGAYNNLSAYYALGAIFSQTKSQKNTFDPGFIKKMFGIMLTSEAYRPDSAVVLGSSGILKGAYLELLNIPTTILEVHRKERRSQMEDSTRIIGRDNISGEKIMIVDDIFQVGTTIDIAKEFLRKRGAKELPVYVTDILSPKETPGVCSIEARVGTRSPLISKIIEEGVDISSASRRMYGILGIF